jgi:hypothetical protein
MTARRRVLTAVLVIGGLLGLGSTVGPAGEPKAPAPASSDFSGKMVIVIYGRGDARNSAVLEKPQVRRLGERAFVVGVGVDEWSADKWAHGITVWVPIDSVVSFMEVSDVEQAKKVFGSAGK